MGRIGSKFAPLEAATVQKAQTSLATSGVTLHVPPVMPVDSDSRDAAADEQYDTEPLPDPLLQVICWPEWTGIMKSVGTSFSLRHIDFTT